MPSERPRLLFYCQHSLGIGHLTRSFALATALSEAFHVVFLNGGRLPPGLPVPGGIEIVDLPPLGMDDGHTLVSRDAKQGVKEAMVRRRALIEGAVQQHGPAVVLIELFPFGRKKFAGEILALMRGARRQAGGPARVVCSLRDILVDARPDQQRHDDRARGLTDRYFDAVLVHADPALARLEDSFKPSRPLRTPVYYTGYVVPARASVAPPPRGEHLLVSAGGGIVGDALFRTVLEARALLASPPPLRLIAGPFLPEPQWRALQDLVQGQAGIELLRQVPDMVAEMRRARASISQCGYNTALDIIVAQVPALVVPYATVTENEQSERATRLAELGALQQLDPGLLTPPQLAAAMQALLQFSPRAAALALDGAGESARLIHGLHLERQP
ncbi:Putative glycosyl transferase [Rubrivivax sp. A210]|uniref:glycosyltransferase family protein n=1 Tax=Rubrivivax sp. A210 TaxID=2772301 RepID=UPI001919FA9A|nr:glycosyltransferase [Rubrivivax sp. A210]CAD5373923.1 Putative glycosyl transferase [Rubrivivax sp. A210]